MADLKSKFMAVYSVLKSELLNDPVFEHNDFSRQWLEGMFDYNAPEGELNLGLSVLNSYRLLKQGEALTEDEEFLSCALGLCLEWLQKYFSVINGVTDDSKSHDDDSYMFKVSKMGSLRMNVGLTLHTHKYTSRILKKHFRGKPYYVDLVDLFNEVMNLVHTRVGEKDLSKFSLSLYRQTVAYKTAYYSLYLPVMCALLMFDENMDNNHDINQEIFIEMAIYFQVRDDYLNCFGHPVAGGKRGTDIQDFNCSWLVVKALDLCNDEQKKTLYENYGKHDSICIAKVEELYKVLKLQDAYLEYEASSYDKITKLIEAHPRKEVQEVLKSFL
ncbi:farnesyl pyrophosphate synthase-like isoform X1 [Andrographis paniculata]|uniref:farnesyl pyrophosphate synthase-like isoform X1 n=1 Tax=Andrographis paniculata TaxID=175694 RepID=UPI0021E94989|nr:farnesyl pyrophosphate synthase-like isoform X1 [Andrographis paniculata]